MTNDKINRVNQRLIQALTLVIYRSLEIRHLPLFRQFLGNALLPPGFPGDQQGAGHENRGIRSEENADH